MNHYWVPGTTIGYEHYFINQLADFLAGISGGSECRPNMRDALRVQKVCDAVLQSAKEEKWVDL